MFSVTWNLKSDGLSIISLVTAAGSLACRSARANSHARSHGYFSFLFFGKCYAIVCVYFCLGKPVKLCVCLRACFLVFKAFRINTDVLAAYTLYSFKHLTASRTFRNHTVLLTEITIVQFLHKEYNCLFFSKFLLDILVVVVGSSCIHTESFLSLLPLSKISQTVSPIQIYAESSSNTFLFWRCLTFR